MTFLEATAEIESHGFSARVNVASDFRTFLRAAAAERATIELARLLKDQETAFRLLRRTLQLAKQGVDFRYEHPRDAAIAVYVWLLATTYQQLGAVASEAAALIPKSWWANTVADAVLRARNFRADRATGVTWEPLVSSPLKISVSAAETGESLVLTDCLGQLASQAEAMGFVSARHAAVEEPFEQVRFLLHEMPGTVEIVTSSSSAQSRRILQ